ncbi:transcription termination/antitermination NusG family protein [Pantoea endophytica]|uniref:Transcription termination/antitermination NusG family protein n=1 Tax=Pantoea sp. BJ2 TaxID=3141322 RepID=A0AAU7U3Z8_9GAMM
MWYLLCFTATRFNYVLSFLDKENMEVYCPKRITRYLRPDKVNSYRDKESPAFPGYLFIKTDFESYHPSNFAKCRYIHGLVNFGGKPAVIKDEDIERVRKCEAGYQFEHVSSSDNDYQCDAWRNILRNDDPDVRLKKMIEYLNLQRKEAA